MQDIKAFKKKLRGEARDVLRSMEAQYRTDASINIRDLFLAHFSALDVNAIIAGTSPMEHELSPIPLMRALEEKGHALCLPVTKEKATPLIFRAYAFGDTLKPDVWNIGVPAEIKPVIEPCVLLCPMLAFDRKGWRLGYGGGYYDATLKSLRAKKKILAVGLAFAAQEMGTVGAGKYDEKLDVIITEKEIIVPV